MIINHQLKQLCDKDCLDVTYKLIKEEGMPHNKTFTMVVMINGENCGMW